MNFRKLVILAPSMKYFYANYFEEALAWEEEKKGIRDSVQVSLG